MNKDTSQMTAREFVEWNYTPRHSHQGKFEEAVAARDAYREKVALENALERAKDAVRNRCSETCTCYGGLRDAILGEPAFVPGQLVRWKDMDGNVRYGVVRRGTEPVNCTSVRVHIDDAGRVIVDEEAPK